MTLLLSTSVTIHFLQKRAPAPLTKSQAREVEGRDESLWVAALQDKHNESAIKALYRESKIGAADATREGENKCHL
jgi:hypothetical protein